MATKEGSEEADNPKPTASSVLADIKAMDKDERREFVELFQGLLSPAPADMVGGVPPHSLSSVSATPDVRPKAVYSNQSMLGTHSDEPMRSAPRISIFSGEGKDTSYQKWKSEVLGLMSCGLYPEVAIINEVRRSVRGLPSDVFMNLPLGVGMTEIMRKFDQMFGNIMPTETLLEMFFTARQKDMESSMAWAVRLEDIVTQLRQRDPHILGDSGRSLVSTFWNGLKSKELKNALRHSLDNMSYEVFLVETRRLEEGEFARGRLAKTAVQNAEDITSSLAKKLDRILALEEQMLQFGKRLEHFEQESKFSGQRRRPQQSSTGKSFKGRCFKCNAIGHMKQDCPLNSSGSDARVNQPVRDSKTQGQK